MTLYAILRRALKYLGFEKVMKEEHLIEGDMTVTASDSLSLRLPGHMPPKHVHVKFADDCVPVPCTPHHHDKLSWNVQRISHHHFELTIHWSVSGVRTVRWSATYDI